MTERRGEERRGWGREEGTEEGREEGNIMFTRGEEKMVKRAAN